MSPYKERYEQFLNTGNPATDSGNAILLHSEGDGSQLPSLFAVDNAEEIAAKAAREAKEAKSQTGNDVVLPPTPPLPNVEPNISVHLFVGGQQYGPFNMDMCRQMVKTGQLTPQTLVWMEGMPAWVPAAQVPALQALFAPPPTPGTPPMPPVPPTPQTPPMPPTM